MILRRISILLIVCALFAIVPAMALKNVCNICATIAENDDTKCKKCNAILNQCLDCEQINPVKNDVCASCSANLDEMRSLAQIDPEVRNDLRLGKTDRSQLERAIGRLDNLMQKHPEQLETLMFRKGEVYFQLKNWGRAATTWREYLTKFPKSPRLALVQASLSDALCKIGWSRYEDRATDEALARFQEAAEANPMNDNAWRMVGQMHRELGQQPQATAAYMKALEANPGHKPTIAFLRQFKATIPPELLKPRPKPVQTASASVTVTGAASSTIQSTPSGIASPVVGGEVIIPSNVTEPPPAAVLPATTSAVQPPVAPVPSPVASIPAPVSPAPVTPAIPEAPSTAPATPAVSAPAIQVPVVPAGGSVPPAAPVPVAPASAPNLTPQPVQASSTSQSPAQPTQQPPVQPPPAATPSDVASIPAPVGQP